MKIEKTNRGFAYGNFTDQYGCDCSIQKSSSADHDCIWLGIDNPKVQIMCRDAISLGLKKRMNDESDNGWMPYPLPTEVPILIDSRMHLTIDQVKHLLPALRHFVKTGDLPPAPSERFGDLSAEGGEVVSDIPRLSPIWASEDLFPDEKGAYVLYADHEAETTRLRKEVERLGLALRNVRALAKREYSKPRHEHTKETMVYGVGKDFIRLCDDAGITESLLRNLAQKDQEEEKEL